jgi:SAM-dependent methyltransferase
MADALFEEPRLARVYDPLDPDRDDLVVYAAIVAESGARSVLDIGCGTGAFACLLAGLGVDVIGVDPAGASLDLARAKPGAERVRWLRCDAAGLPPLQVELATMTGNVAQVFSPTRNGTQPCGAPGPLCGRAGAWSSRPVTRPCRRGGDGIAPARCRGPSFPGLAQSSRGLR